MQLLLAVLGRVYTQGSAQSQRGQSTVEYIVVTLAAATLAFALVDAMQGLGKIADIFNRIIDSVLGLF